MRVWFTPSKSIQKRFFWLLNYRSALKRHIPRVFVLGTLLIYVALVFFAFRATLGSGVLLFKVAPCQEAYCVSWVMPGGKAWSQGARPGMLVNSVDGENVDNLNVMPDVFHISGAELLDSEGRSTNILVTENAIGQSPMKFSLWVLGGMFASMGSLVVIRRPDLYTAWLFGVFATFTASALSVAPSSGGPAPLWALVVQQVSLIGVGVFFLPFAVNLALAGRKKYSHSIVLALWTIVGSTVLLGYVYSALISPTAYEIFRPALLFFLASSCIGAIVILSIGGFQKQSSFHRQQVRIALLGVALGTLPFIMLTLVPEALWQTTLIPVHISILSWGLMPIFFAYAILQYQLLGIRRLVHRGIVYAVTTVLLIGVMTLGFMLVTPLVGARVDSAISIPVLLVYLSVAVVLFFPIRTGTIWLVDRFVYRDVVDYRMLVDIVRDDLFAPEKTQQLAEGMARSLLDGLGLESVLIVLEGQSVVSEAIAEAGERSQEVLQHILPRLESMFNNGNEGRLIELRWESDSLLTVPLQLQDKDLGFLVLGPKRGGEVFIEEEKRLFTTVLPMIALAIDKSQLSEELRALYRHLVDAEEEERARISREIHDGPLQKAMLIARTFGHSAQEPEELARQLANELREVCSTLRPTILDDLGLVSSLDWLLETVETQSSLEPHLTLGGVDEDDRWSPQVELALFRVTQESANNAIKYSQGSHLDVSLLAEDDALVLTVADNGIGFSMDNAKKGLGLSGMQERILQVKGSFEVRSTPGIGTTVMARIPWSEGGYGDSV